MSKREKPELTVYYAPVCNKCPLVRKMIRQIEPELKKMVEIKEINTATDEGFKRAMKQRILGLPQITLRDPDRPDTEKPYVRGVPKNKEDLLRTIQQAAREYER